MYKLRDWIDINKLDWFHLSYNHNAIDLLEKNFDKINWYNLSFNPFAIHLLHKNLDKINWSNLSLNSGAIYILEKNILVFVKQHILLLLFPIKVYGLNLF
jgi:hypothetical protein